jgi:P-type Ca2+ transporter type 2C
MNQEFNEKGLTDEEAKNILEHEGLNQLPSDKQKGLFSIFLATLKEPMFLLLIISVAIYFILGSVKEALALLGSISIIIGISFYQNQKTEKALEALKELSEPQVLVIRDGIQKKILSKELVPGDMMILSEGERITADGAIISTTNLTVDESVLTGESLAVSKISWDGKSLITRPGGNNLPFIYSGTLITSGHCLAKVLFTGQKSEIGKIGKELSQIQRGQTLLQKETRKLILKLGIIGGFICFLIVLIYGLMRNNWLEGFLAGITLSMSLLPEEFAVILTVFLALGAWRIAKKKVLTRDIPIIETLGAATVLCTDKTGTITFNKMSIEKLYCQGNIVETVKNKNLDACTENLIEYALFASRKHTFDPIEKAIFEFANSQNIIPAENKELIKEYPFSKNIMAITNIWQIKGSNTNIIASKGAPETILELCHLEAAKKKEILYQVSQMAEIGLKVLAIARGKLPDKTLPDTQDKIKFEFLGIIGFNDPIRPSVNQAVSLCYQAGLKVLMITGDYPGTASHIASKIGLNNFERVVTGLEIEKMSEAEIREIVKSVTVFARITPQEKLKLVNALKMNGEIVTMTGDGVNDAPALKSAQIGIAIGERSTDVAKEASSLVLLDGDFSSLVETIKLGRRIFNNLKRAMIYVLAIHVPIAGIALIPPLFNLPLILFPLHIVFLELVIDPSSSVAFETTEGDKDIMQKPPRDLKKPFLDNRVLLYSMTQGAIILAGCTSLMLFCWYLKLPETVIRTITFITLITSNIGLMFINLNGPGNIWQSITGSTTTVRLILGGTASLLTLIISIPVLRDLFLFSPLTSFEILIYLIFSTIIIFSIEIFENIITHRSKNIL